MRSAQGCRGVGISARQQKTKKEEIMDAKELLEELKVKADELHKYLEAHPDEANMMISI